MANVTLFQNRNSLFVKFKFPVLKNQGIGPQGFVFSEGIRRLPARGGGANNTPSAEHARRLVALSFASPRLRKEDGDRVPSRESAGPPIPLRSRPAER